MARKVTQDDILVINQLYYKTKVYAEVARQTGFSATTVKKYVIPGWQPPITDDIKRFEGELPPINHEIFKRIENYGDLCVYSDAEFEEIRELWEELMI